MCHFPSKPEKNENNRRLERLNLTFLMAGVQIRGVTKATISQAKMRLEALVEAALRGEYVVITCGKKPAVAIVPAESARTQALRVSDAAADYLAQEARAELENGLAQVHESAAALAASLRKPPQGA